MARADSALLRFWKLQKIANRQRSTRKPRRVHRTLVVVARVNARSYGRTAGALWRDYQFALALYFVANVIVKHLAVVDRGDAVPRPERMQLLAIQKSAGVPCRDCEAVEAPLPVHDANLEQHALAGNVLPRRGIDRLQMKDPLRRFAIGIGPEDHLPRPRLGPGQRMHRDEQRIVHAIEGDSLADIRVDDARSPQHL